MFFLLIISSSLLLTRALVHACVGYCKYLLQKITNGKIYETLHICVICLKIEATHSEKDVPRWNLDKECNI